MRIIAGDQFDAGIHHRGDESEMRDSRYSFAMTSFALWRRHITERHVTVDTALDTATFN
jgi:hypothetical protein